MRIVFVAAIGALAASAASAADLETLRPSFPAQPDAVRTIDWSGPEFGLSGGADLVTAGGSKFAETQYFPGGRLGAFAGYQQQFSNNVVLGVEGDIAYTFNQNDNYTYYYNGYPIGAEKLGTDWSGSVRARVGYAFDNILLYATAGWAGTRAFDVIDTLGTTRELFSGYTLGAGIDYAFSKNIFVRTEYRFSDYGVKTAEKDGSSIDLKQHVINVALGVKF